MPVAIDTLAYSKLLEQAGFSVEQAEGQARALAAAMTDSLATKQDLRELAAKVDARFTVVDQRFEHLERHLDTRLMEMEARFDARLEGRLEGGLADLERRMTVRLGGMMLAGIGAVSMIVTRT